MSNTQWWFCLVISLLMVALIYCLSSVLAPFFVSALIAYLGDPAVSRMQAWKIPRTLGVVIVFFILFISSLLLLLWLVPLLEHQIMIFLQRIPLFINWVQIRVIPWLNQYMPLHEQFNVDTLKGQLSTHWQDAGNILLGLWRWIGHSGYAILGFLASVLLVPVVSFYLLRDWHRLVAASSELLPRRIEPKVRSLLQQCDEIIGAFFRGQLLVMLALAFLYSVGLVAVGLDVALIIGLLAGLLSIVPYLGFIVGFVSAVLAVIFQFHDGLHVLYVAIVFGLGQALESMFLTPVLVGDRIGLHPVAVIFAILVGGQLFGFVGVLLALPVAASIMVLLRELHQHYMNSKLYA